MDNASFTESVSADIRASIALGPGNHGYSQCFNHQIASEELMLTVAFDAMRICLGKSPIHHEADDIGRFIQARAAIAKATAA